MQPSASGASPGSRTRRRARRCSCWTPTSSTRPAGRSRIRIRRCSNPSSRRRCSGSGSRRSSSTTCWSSGAFRSPGWGCTGSRSIWAARRPLRLVRPSTRSRRIASSILSPRAVVGRVDPVVAGRAARAGARPRWKAGVRLGLLVTLQMAASMYYGLFLVVTLAVLRGRGWRRIHGGRAGPVRLIRLAAIAAAIGRRWRRIPRRVQPGGRATGRAQPRWGPLRVALVLSGRAWHEPAVGRVTSGFYWPELALFPVCGAGAARGRPLAAAQSHAAGLPAVARVLGRGVDGRAHLRLIVCCILRSPTSWLCLA